MMRNLAINNGNRLIRCLKGVIILICAALLSGCGNKEELPLMEQGFLELRAGNYQNAQKMFEEANSEGASEKEILRALGMCESLKGNYEGAVDYYTKALACSNGIISELDIDITYYRAIAEYKNGNFENAVKAYDSIIDINPKADNAYYMRGKAYLANGNKQKAIEDYDMALMIAPNDFDHYLRICEDLSGQGYDNEGKQYIQAALDKFNKLSDYQQGVLSYYMGDYNKARGALENARQNKSSPEDTVIFLAKTYEKLGDLDYSVSMYEECIQNNTMTACAHLGIGNIRMLQKDYQAALESFEKGVLVNDPDYIKSLMFNRIVAYEYNHDFENAKNLMAEYITIYPDDEKAQRENVFLSTR